MSSYLVVRHSERGYRAETFDTDKLRDSLERACFTAGSSDGATDDIVSRAITKLLAWSGNKQEVTDDDIRRRASEVLEQLCPEAGYLYKHQKSIL